MDVILAGKNLFFFRTDANGTLAANTFASAKGIQNYTNSASCFKNRGTRMYRDLPAVRLKNYVEMLHLSLVACNRQNMPKQQQITDIKLFYAVLSSGHAFFYCLSCVCVWAWPFTSPKNLRLNKLFTNTKLLLTL